MEKTWPSCIYFDVVGGSQVVMGCEGSQQQESWRSDARLACHRAASTNIRETGRLDFLSLRMRVHKLEEQ